jgi:hypothetical protein
MNKESNKHVLRIEASAFSKKEGDPVAKGERLGYFNGRPVQAPCNATIACLRATHRQKGVSFNAEEHELIVVLVPRP